MMKNVIIFGAASQGSKLKKQLEHTNEYDVRYFCDNNPGKWQESLNGIKIISIDDIKKLGIKGFNGIMILAVRNPWQVIDQIQAIGGIHMPIYGVARGYMKQSNDINKMLYFIDIRKPYLDYLEYHISDHCNLKCRGCGHYSNIAVPRFGDLEKYIKDLERLKELFLGVKTIRLMGGEPLLNNKLPDFMSYTRDIFPGADIMVVTNGLLIPDIEEKVFGIMSRYSIRFDISLYPPTERIKERIELRCIENEVDYHFSEPIYEFYDCINYTGDSNKNIAHEKCESKGCHFLEDGKIAACCLPIVYKRQQRKLPWKMDIGENDIVDLYSEDLDGYKLKEILSKPMEMCRYCSDGTMRYFDWQGSYPYCEDLNSLKKEV